MNCLVIGLIANPMIRDKTIFLRTYFALPVMKNDVHIANWLESIYNSGFLIYA